MTVLTLVPPEKNEQSVADQLRAIADRLDAGEIPPTYTGALVLIDDGPGIFTASLGQDSNDLQLLGVLELGKMSIADGCFG